MSLDISINNLKKYIINHLILSSTFLMMFSIAITIRLFVCFNFGSIQYDEGIHSLGGIFISKLLFNNLKFPSEFLHNYPATIDGIWFYPPLYAILSSIGFLILGYTEFAARLVNVIFSILVIHASICIAKEIDPDEKVLIVTAFLSSFSSIIIIVGSGAMVDVPLAVLVSYSILYYIKGLKTDGDGYYLKAGILGGLAGLMKPIGIAPLLFAFGYRILLSIGKDGLRIPKDLWKGLFVGLLIVSTWWVSAVVIYLIDDSIGQAAVSSVMFWFEMSVYKPPWYSPPWSTLEGWTYYLDGLIFTMGILPFASALIGIIVRLRKRCEVDHFLIGFMTSIYLILVFIYNKSPRYIIPIIPILFVYSGIGLISVYRNIVYKNKLDKFMIGLFRKGLSIFLCGLVLLNFVFPLISAIEVEYIPGQNFGESLPLSECVQIIQSDGSGGIVMLDSQPNSFNTPAVSFYLSRLDDAERYGCNWLVHDPSDLIGFEVYGMSLRYVLVNNVTSDISRFVLQHPEVFDYLSEVKNEYGEIIIYKVKASEFALGSFTITTANGGESWAQGTTHAITWTKSGSTGSCVKIELLKEGVLNKVINASTLNDGIFNWAISTTQTPGSDYRVRVTSIDYPSVTDTSDTTFEITEPPSGYLRVSTDPAVVSTITVDDVPRNDWGIDWVKMPTGTYTVSFGDVPGYGTPETQVATVSQGRTTTVTGTFAPMGYLRVTIDPTLPATIYLDGRPLNDWGAWLPLAPGRYTVSFGSVSGYATPSNQAITVNAGGTTTITGHYVSGSSTPPTGYGYLRVVTSPAVPGTISVDGLPSNDWGLDWVKMPTGKHVVSFSGVPGYKSPDPQTVTVNLGETTVITGAYVRLGYLYITTIPSCQSTIYLDGYAMNDWGCWVTLPAGNYTVTWGPVSSSSGEVPNPEEISVMAGQTTKVTGVFP